VPGVGESVTGLVSLSPIMHVINADERHPIPFLICLRFPTHTPVAIYAHHHTGKSLNVASSSTTTRTSNSAAMRRVVVW